MEVIVMSLVWHVGFLYGHENTLVGMKLGQQGAVLYCCHSKLIDISLGWQCIILCLGSLSYVSYATATRLAWC